jgi:pyruvate dehydrogenase E1 component alpha subunit
MADHPLPDAEVAAEWLATMLLIRRFEERASALYAAGEIGGFLHSSIGEEAVIVGALRALEARDPLLSTYRAHGHALARGTEPGRVMAELLGRVDGTAGGRGGSTHVFDAEHGFYGGWGIVGGNLPIAAGFALAADLRDEDSVTLCQFGDGAANQGTFGETLNVAALWGLPIVFLVTNNRGGAVTAPTERHTAVGDLFERSRAFGVQSVRCDGMDPAATFAAVGTAVGAARAERRPMLVEALIHRVGGASAADPESATEDGPAQVRRRDPVVAFGDRLVDAGLLPAAARTELDRAAVATVDAAVAFARASPEPAPATLLDHVLAR